MAKRSPKRKLIIYILGGIVVLVLVIQSVIIQQLYARTAIAQPQIMKDVLIDAVKNLNNQLAVEPTTGRRYIPSARIVLPPETDRRLYYRGGQDATAVSFTDAANQSQAISKVWAAESLENVFSEIGTVQMCSRQIVINFNAQADKGSNDKLTLKNTKALKDGRTAYIYQNECPYGAESILKDIAQIESF